MARYGNIHRGGRPSRTTEQQRLEAIHRAGETATGSNSPYLELWCRIWAQAMEGNPQAQRMILEHTYGRPAQLITTEREPVELVITRAVD